MGSVSDHCLSFYVVVGNSYDLPPLSFFLISLLDMKSGRFSRTNRQSCCRE